MNKTEVGVPTEIKVIRQVMANIIVRCILGWSDGNVKKKIIEY
jgi:hypothetical protein